MAPLILSFTTYDVFYKIPDSDEEDEENKEGESDKQVR